MWTEVSLTYLTEHQLNFLQALSLDAKTTSYFILRIVQLIFNVQWIFNVSEMNDFKWFIPCPLVDTFKKYRFVSVFSRQILNFKWWLLVHDTTYEIFIPYHDQ